jgi:hypothetical protein
MGIIQHLNDLDAINARWPHIHHKPEPETTQLEQENSTVSNDQKTQLGQITGTLRDLAQVFAIVTPYASTEPTRPAQQLATITGQVFECCDSYAAVRHTTDQLTTAATPQPFTLPALEVSKALTAAAKLVGKHAGQVTATLTATPEAWTLTTTAGQTHTGNNPQHDTPNTGAIWTAAQTTTETTFEPFSLAQWQIERLAKTTKQAANNDQPATLTNYSTSTKPVIYTITTGTSTTQVLIMPTKTK